MPLINCGMFFILTQSEGCVIASMETRLIAARQRDASPTGATFQITDAKLYVPAVTLSTKSNKRLLEQVRL